MASGSSPWAATQPTARPGPAEALRRSREGRAGNEHAAAAGAGAFEAAVEEHYAGLVRRMVLVLGDPDEARDVAQEAYLAAFRAWDRFEGEDARAWLHTIALRLAFNQLRRRRRWLAAFQRLEPKAWADPSDPDLWAALRLLDPRTRSALLMNVVDGFTQAEIGTMLGVPEGTVASWLSRGRAVLRRALSRDDERLSSGPSTRAGR